MGQHPLGSFIQDLLSTSDAFGKGQQQRERGVSLVVDNARMALDNPKNRALRERFRPEQQHQPLAPLSLPRATNPSVRLTRKQSLDVSDHTRGESRWGAGSSTTTANKTSTSTSTSSGLCSSVLMVTPSRERRHQAGQHRQRERKTSSPTTSIHQQLSPVVEENRKKGQTSTTTTTSGGAGSSKPHINNKLASAGATPSHNHRLELQHNPLSSASRSKFRGVLLQESRQ